jgi:sodium/potassium-transporting ATPase subunit alpha
VTEQGPLATDPARGLTASEAARRLVEIGPNRLEPVEAQALWRRFVGELTHLLALVLWAAAALALFAGIHDPGSGMTTLGVAIIAVILVNGGFSFWQEHRADQALRLLEKLLPRHVTVVRDATPSEVEADVLVPGDVVLLEAGARVPADGRVVEARAAKVDTSTLTGESVPQGLDVDGALAQNDQPPLFAGTVLVAGRVTMVVTATGRSTRFSGIADQAQLTTEATSPIHREIRQVSRTVTLLAIALGLVFLVIGRLRGLDWTAAVMFGIGIIVANVPEGMLPTVTLALAMSAQRMAKRKALVRHLPAVEALGAATVICTDKTGTLTENRMRVEHWFVPGRGEVAVVAGDAEPPGARLLSCALLCHDLVEGHGEVGDAFIGDPMEVALVAAARRSRPTSESPERLDEIPFDTKRKRLVTLHREGRGRVAYVKGALEVVLTLATSVEVNGRQVPVDDALRDELVAAERSFGERGLRVLAFGYRLGTDSSTVADLDQDLVLTGLAALRDPPRPEVAAAMSACHLAGIRVIMFTGDHPTTASAIAREIGLVRGSASTVLTGAQVGAMSDVELQLALGAQEIVLSRMAPEDKTRIVLALQRKGDIVAVTGDGVNDAPALRAADVGVAMGRTGTDVARAVADIVLLDDNFASIVAAIEEGRGVYANVRKFLVYILTSNVPELVPFLAFVLFRIPLPLTIVQILAVDLGTDMVPALGLGAERPGDDAMRRPPRSRSERLLTGGMLLRAYGFLGVIEAMAGMTAYGWVLWRGGWEWGTELAASDPLYKSATTACLMGIVVAQVGNVFACKTERERFHWRRLFDNRIVLVGVGIELSLMVAIAYTSVGQAIFGTAPIDASTWLVAAPFAFLVFFADEARRGLVRGWERRHAR